MTQGSDQAEAGAGAGAAGSGSGTPPPRAPTTAAGVAGAMTLGSILTVAGILLLFIFFAFGIVSLQYCFNAWDRESRQRERSHGRRTAAAAGGSSRGGATRTSRGGGVDPELLRSLPVTVYNHASDDDKQQGAAAVECAVCLAELQDGEEARFLPRCGHGFHAQCVDTWLASHTTCPLCRLTVSKPDGVSPPAAPPSSLALPRVAPEPANYAAANLLPAGVLLGVSGGHGAVVTSGAGSAVAALVIEIPESSVPAPTLTAPCDVDAAKSPGSARLRSIRRLWSFGRQGAGASATSSCSCAGASTEGVDMEKGIS